MSRALQILQLFVSGFTLYFLLDRTEIVTAESEPVFTYQRMPHILDEVSGHFIPWEDAHYDPVDNVWTVIPY
jgi:hypothetical protein